MKQVTLLFCSMKTEDQEQRNLFGEVCMDWLNVPQMSPALFNGSSAKTQVESKKGLLLSQEGNSDRPAYKYN